MQGFNMGRYVPPDVEGTTTGNKLHKKKPPSFSRDGTQTVRFEMPFAVWCQHCAKPTIIGQGVRFNATKRKVGAYLSTPVFAFRMRHADCGGAIEIRTDPQNTTYVVVEGAKKRDTGDGGGGEDLISSSGAVEPILTDKERENLRGSAFARLERTIEDRQVLAQARERIGELEDDSARRWEDPYGRNRALRAAFRAGRRERERDAAAAEDLRDRMSLGIDLLPASEADARRAALVDFGEDGSADGREEAPTGRKALAKPLFYTDRPKPALLLLPPAADDDGKKAKKRRLKSEAAAAQMRDNLVSEIVGNTRVARDPFLSIDRGSRENAKSTSRIASIKRKRPETETELRPEEWDGATVEKGRGESEASKGASSLTTLVEYDSD